MKFLFNMFNGPLRNEAGGEGGDQGGGAGGEGNDGTLFAGGGDGGGQSTFVNADGSFTEGWHASLGEGYEGFSKFKNVGDLAKSYRHLESKQPAYPGEDAKPEDVARFRQLAGVPDSVEGYGLKAPEQLPEGVAWDGKTMERFAAVAHQYHVSAQAMQALAGEFLAYQGDVAAMIQKDQVGGVERAREELQKAWGNDFGTKIQTAENVHKSLLPSLGVSTDSEEAKDLAKNPLYVRLLHEVSRYMRGDSKAVATPSGGDVLGGKERAQDIINNPKNPLYQSYWDGDENTQKMVKQLIAQ